MPDYEAVARTLTRAADTITQAYKIENPVVKAAALAAARTQVGDLLDRAAAALRAE